MNTLDTLTTSSIAFGIAVVLAIVCIIFAVMVLTKWNSADTRYWRTLAFLGCGLLPAMAIVSLSGVAIAKGTKTEFCLSCHVMKDYGKSLHADDDEYIPAVHFQNNWVPKEKACYTCHTSYTWYGPLAGKVRGMQHMYRNFVRNDDEKLELYDEYDNGNCLRCHRGSKKFEKRKPHKKPKGVLQDIYSNKTSCLAKGCHDVTHEIDEFEEE